MGLCINRPENQWKKKIVKVKNKKSISAFFATKLNADSMVREFKKICSYFEYTT